MDIDVRAFEYLQGGGLERPTFLIWEYCYLLDWFGLVLIEMCVQLSYARVVGWRACLFVMVDDLYDLFHTVWIGGD